MLVNLTDIGTLPLQCGIFKYFCVFGLYDVMDEDMQTKYKIMEPLQTVFENKACIALCPNDQHWYRASILQYNQAKNLVRIRYIDYGDSDVIPVSDTREICSEWMWIPPASLNAKMFGMQLNPEMDLSVVVEQCSRILFEAENFKAHILGYEGSLPLVELKYITGESLQSEFIKREIFINCTTSVVRHNALIKNNFALTRVRNFNSDLADTSDTE